MEMKLAFHAWVSCVWIPGCAITSKLQHYQLLHETCENLIILRLLISISHLVISGQSVQKFMGKTMWWSRWIREFSLLWAWFCEEIRPTVHLLKINLAFTPFRMNFAQGNCARMLCKTQPEQESPQTHLLELHEEENPQNNTCQWRITPKSTDHDKMHFTLY